MKKLWQALEDSADCLEYVETLPRLGYRFMMSVEWVREGNPPNVVTMASPEGPPLPHLVASPIPHRRRLGVKAVAALAGLAVAAGAILLFESQAEG